ncbi:MAG: peptidase MA family metallohydrolase [Chloroflexota bacterium]
MSLSLFPQMVLFGVDVESGETIERIALVYRTNMQSCQENGATQILDFESGTAVTASWTWELFRSGNLPPGAEISWRWEVQTASGTTISPTKRLTITDPRHDWRNLTRGGIEVNWYVGDRAFGEAMWAESNRSLQRLSEEVGIERPEAIQLWFYPTAEEVRNAVVNVPEWTGGLAFPEYGITVLGVAPGQTEWAAEIIPHELAHLVIGQRIFNCRGLRLPTWLNEGLATYAEGPMKVEDAARVENSLQARSLPPLTSLENGFSAFGSSASLAYLQSAAVVGYLVETYGAEAMNNLLGEVQRGTAVDDALILTYGLDASEIDAVWRLSRGVAATPTSAADVAALEATATVVPTVALGGIPVVQASETPTETPEPTSTPLAPSPTPLLPTATVTSAPTVAETEVGPTEVVQTAVIASANPTTAPATQNEPDSQEETPPAASNVQTWFIASAVVFVLLLLLTYRRMRKSRARID